MMNSPGKTGDDEMVKKADRAAFFSAQNSLAERGVWGLLYINAGGAIATLSFIKGTGSDNSELLLYAVVSLLLFGLGVAFAAAEFFVMYHTSVAHQYEKETKKRWKRISIAIQIGTIILFLGAVGTLGIGLLHN